MGLKVPIGIDDFGTLIGQDFLYVDKTLMIEEVLQTSAAVQQITRPRRFGKTINLSMLRYFFDCRLVDSGALFRGLAIEGRSCFTLLGAYPVISLTFKNLKADNFEIFLGLFATMMSDLYHEHDYLLADLKPSERTKFEEIVAEEASQSKLLDSLAFLMKLLERHFGRKVILLLDEYDSPIHEGYAHDYYEKVIGMMRPYLGKALKGNTSLEKAVLTGILRVGKESIFSDLNNLKVYSVLDLPFSDKFGFTVPEVASLLERSGRGDQQKQVDEWYNGYLMGETVIYNPWSILNYLDDQRALFQPYWVNTSFNALVRDQILKAPPNIHDQLKLLIQGETVETQISQHITFRNLSVTEKNFWSFFLFCGYLKVSCYQWRDQKYFYELAIPNAEIKQLFETIISDWLSASLNNHQLQTLLSALVEGKFRELEQVLGSLVASVLSYYDTEQRYAERVYHAFVLGLVVHLSSRYEIHSNRESGFGRYDLLLRPRNLADRGIIMEFKAAETPGDKTLDEAEKQLQSRAYATELEKAGVTLRSEIAVVFCGKQLKLRGREISLK